MKEERQRAPRRWIEVLLHVHDTPTRTAAAYAVGVFFGFNPLFGLHTIGGLAVAFVFNLNRVAVLLGVYSNLPWVIVPFYASATMLGAFLLQTNLPEGFRDRLVEAFALPLWRREFWAELGTLLEPLFWPFMLGSTVAALLLAVIAYGVALAVLRRFGRGRLAENADC